MSDRPDRLTRRTLLKGAAATAALGPLAACSDDGAPAGAGTTPTTTGPTPTTTPSSGDTTTSVPAGTTTTTAPAGTTSTTTSTTIPTAVDESWNEPWVWRPSDWPGDTLGLNVVENQNPGAVIGFGNPKNALFSYGGTTPGPTIRMRGDEILGVTLRNLLGPDLGETYVGPYPDANELTGYVDGRKLTVPVAQELAQALGNRRFDYCLGEHTNGQHTIHSTNLHTHGLHVRPGRNPDGTHSDNVILRLIPQGDLARREQTPSVGVDQNEAFCNFLRDGDQINFLADDDQVGRADYEFRLGDTGGARVATHPPGTHWYHPHSHGSTGDQVSSGMAGFLIVEGDVDDAVRGALVPDETEPGDPAVKAGPNDYRERLMFIQRVFNTPTDPDAPSQSLQKNARPNADAVNGSTEPSTIFMRPNAVERWRVLNGSVDGKGFRRIMVLRGRFGTDGNDHLIRVNDDGTPGPTVTRAEVEAAKVRIHQLAFDGVTLVTTDGGYQIKDLGEQGDPDAPFPLADFGGPDPDFAVLADRYVDCFADGDSIRNCYVRRNEVYLGPANRTDVMFSAPPIDDGDIEEYSVIALGVILHADTPLQGMQENVVAPFERALDRNPDQPDQPPPASQKKVGPPAGPGDVVIARLVVTGEARTPFDIQSINSVLPDVPAYLRPIDDSEPGLAAPDGGFRTRTITYSGWGANAIPLITARVDPESDGDDQANETPTSQAFSAFIRTDLAKPSGERLEGLRYVRRTNDGPDDYVLLAPNTRTMAIDGRKFNPTDPDRPRMFLGSAEEWVVYNVSDALWADTSANALSPTQYSSHYDAEPLELREGMERFRANNAFQLVSRAVDHPFHMHQNPFWVTRIDVPASDGSLHNILEEPRWMDVVPVPRHRGRVVFRSRFPDFVGTYVNHCHILLHEDNGMMQPVEVTPFDQRRSDADSINDVARANYVPRASLAQGGTDAGSADDVSSLYPRPTLAEGYVQNISFLDDNASTGQAYPGFDVTAPG